MIIERIVLHVHSLFCCPLSVPYEPQPATITYSLRTCGKSYMGAGLLCERWHNALERHCSNVWVYTWARLMGQGG